MKNIDKYQFKEDVHTLEDGGKPSISQFRPIWQSI